MPLKGLTPGTFASFPSPRPAASGGSNIKSIQQNTASMPSSTTLNVTIAPVDITKSVVIVYPSGSHANINGSCILGALTSSTNIQFTTFAASTEVFAWEVIEFQNLKSFQSGNVTSSGGTAAVTIASVNLAKAVLFLNFKPTNNSISSVDAFVSGYLSAATTITFNTSSINKNINWYVVEFY